MTVHARPALPAGHGEVLMRPHFSEWAGLAASNRDAASSWRFLIGGIAAGEMRSLARAELLELGTDFSSRIGVPVRSAVDDPDVIIATGHQPELYHPGVWVKDFLLQRLSDETGCAAIDLVVDSDGFDTLGVSSPCLTPGVARCEQYLAVGTGAMAYAQASVPSSEDLETFCESTDLMLSTLPAPAIRKHFARFCVGLKAVRSEARNLAEIVTFARRRYEEAAGSDYLEAPVTELSRGEAFARFVMDLALDADRFSAAYNSALAEYREHTKTRSNAQPFPDLSVADGLVELPLWVLADHGRLPVFSRAHESGCALIAGDRILVELPGDHAQAVAVLLAADIQLAPKALALTLFVRCFCCDLFIHGVGGGRYDRVTDTVIRTYYGVEPPAFAVASMTMYLPLGAHAVSDDEVAAAKARLNRLEHNPDALLCEVEFDDATEQHRVSALAAEKRDLVTAIASPDADRKSLGLRIRQVNADLARALAPLRTEFEAQLASLEAQKAAAEILTDRTYPFCFWAPEEVADKVR